ncbi:sodium/glutamate symporter [Ramlibacter sp. G-1-2-2]|uniref:Sodium/glutamate symporter n=1 Tax=Ramlibacter agri TaxID=2728837 RepID=A0A848H4M1_9BURK|nr:sodium/glutamate symporter [Ramlibacter agri]NML45437.1 sodium/glutamate symporter [Ramlibacter agri]
MALHTVAVDSLASFTLAILLLFVGKGLARRYPGLRRYSIPDSVAGGLCCAAVVLLLYLKADVEIVFDLPARDLLLLYFFAALGLSTDVRTLAQRGRGLVVLLALATGFMLLQNFAGMAMARAFGMDARLGLMAGSISLTGGVGTTLAWTPHFTQRLGLEAAGELGLAANMLGLVSACVVGGPIALFLIRRHGVQPSGGAELEVGVRHSDEATARLDYDGVMLALLWLNAALVLGQELSGLIARTGLQLPAFVGCLMAGIVLRGLGGWLAPRGRGLWRWPRMQPSVALISDICLGLFITMALMGLQLSALHGILGYIAAAMLLQVLLAVAFTVLVVFRAMGRDYEAAVVCAGFGGIALGSTATAVANMTSVTREFGAAPRAFIVVPLVCGFFIDLANALVIGWLAR